MADLLPNRAMITMGVVSAITAYSASFLVNRAPQLASIPGFKFIANVEQQGLMESSAGLIVLEILTQMIARRVL